MIRKISIVIPVYNEAAMVATLIERVKAVDLGALEREILAVDDGSTDGTGEALKRIQGIRVLRHERNRGKGAAVKTGFAAATGDVLLVQDADLEYDPEDYRALLEPILAGRVEAVIGSRFAKERPRFFVRNRRQRAPFMMHYLGNRVIILLTNALYGQSITDYEACYKVLTKRLAQRIPVLGDGFEFENELLCKLFRLGYPVEEIPVRYRPRTYAEGKKIRWSDAVRVISAIAIWRVRPLRGMPRSERAASARATWQHPVTFFAYAALLVWAGGAASAWCGGHWPGHAARILVMAIGLLPWKSWLGPRVTWALEWFARGVLIAAYLIPLAPLALIVRSRGQGGLGAGSRKTGGPLHGWRSRRPLVHSLDAARQES